MTEETKNVMDVQELVKSAAAGPRKRLVFRSSGDGDNFYRNKTIDREATERLRTIEKMGSKEDVRALGNTRFFDEFDRIRIDPNSVDWNAVDKLMKDAEANREYAESGDAYLGFINEYESSAQPQTKEDTSYLPPKQAVSVFDKSDADYMRKDNYPQEEASGIGFGDVAKGKNAISPKQTIKDDRSYLIDPNVEEALNMKVEAMVKSGMYNEFIARQSKNGFTPEQIFEQIKLLESK